MPIVSEDGADRLRRAELLTEEDDREDDRQPPYAGRRD
jgi:hypothetical protein